ncbi:oocyte zinc finger protein XlCOF6-like [Battus philenor]|uniref:oocyte zinc finger protein XlCOF6-like n=1 Tax=Battus philenor TaxID=42288 RepID=UPI0035D09764
MSNLKICRICLRTEAKVYKYDQFQLKSYYEEVMALKVNESDGLPQYFCYECSTILHKFHKFKEKCYRGQKVFKELLWRGPVTYETLYKVDRLSNGLQSDVSIIAVTNRVKTYKTIDSKIQEVTENDKEELDDNYISDNSIDNKEPNSPKTVFIDIKKECIQLENEYIQSRRKSKSGDEGNTKKRLLDAGSWKVYTLSEEDAVKEFRLRAEEQKYLSASFKCQDCFKGFSKEDMLKRHIQLRHSEELGCFECRFCRMRFKWDCHLRRHMRQHYTKYECLRCHLICPLENTAILHEEYHSGVTKTCNHCGQQFRHSSTYYTHLRTHRSEFVCSSCGASFVSEAGLHQHKRVKHVNNDIDSPDDDEEVNTYCVKCDIRFETRKAYEGHLFHSAMHSKDIEVDSENQESAPRKVLGKKMQAKITKELRRRKADDNPLMLDIKKRRRLKRKHRKPTTCHQCGKHFDTQTACMKHHQTEHPRTSFFPPNERHICEICGASLAPGSVATHQNMHTRSKVHPCATCGKQFYSSVGLKRHLVTHTGEKPFACPLCDKRFTQSNSMKLHYRTFHLKQAYPKRTRTKKKKEDDAVEIEETSDDSDSSLPEQDLENPLLAITREPDSETGLGTEIPVPSSNGLQAVHDVPDRHIADENIHYLTLA